MNRIEERFDALRASHRKGLVGYLTAGDPDLTQSEDHVRAALAGGLDLLELGVPFSDPTADGPTIQAASQRALQSGTTLSDVLDMVGRLRSDFDTPIILFGYANLFFRYGYEEVCARAAEVGVDGMLVVDLPFEESDELLPMMERHDLCLIPLIAPTTPEDRMRQVLAHAKGFVYYIMVTGVTGAREQVVQDLGGHIRDLRTATPLPIAAGFGVSNGAQAREVAQEADAVVVGSALVKAAQEGGLRALVDELRSALDAG